MNDLENNELPIGENTTPVSKRSAWADWFGTVASIGCAIHCAAMPLVLAYLPALGLSWLADDGFHRWMAAVCFVLAAAAFVPGWRRHGSFVPTMWGASGIAMLVVAAFFLEGHCCSACSAESANSQAAATCSDVDCEFCDSQPTIQPPAESGLLAYTPLVTPLGGLLLVTGHLTNHRLSHRCNKKGCCS